MNTENLTEAISKSLELWTIITLYDIALILLLLGAILHYAEGFFSESKGKFYFRVSKENWSILFFIIRDFSLFAAFGISLLLINPDMFADVKFPVPFFPVATVLLGIALIYKLRGKMNTSPSQERLFNIFLISATVVQFSGFVLVMEAAPAEWVNSGYASEFWLVLRSLRSNVNPVLSMWSFFISFPALIIIFLVMIKAGINRKKETTSLEK
jgi:hypothetical protein